MALHNLKMGGMALLPDEYAQVQAAKRAGAPPPQPGRLQTMHQANVRAVCEHYGLPIGVPPPGYVPPEPAYVRRSVWLENEKKVTGN